MILRPKMSYLYFKNAVPHLYLGVPSGKARCSCQRSLGTKAAHRMHASPKLMLFIFVVWLHQGTMIETYIVVLTSSLTPCHVGQDGRSSSSYTCTIHTK
jgi:hypothetical protein